MDRDRGERGWQEAGLLDDAIVDESERISLCEALDRVLHKGVVVRGDLVISVASVDLVHLSLQLVLCSMDTALRAGLALPAPPAGGRGGEIERALPRPEGSE